VVVTDERNIWVGEEEEEEEVRQLHHGCVGTWEGRGKENKMMNLSHVNKLYAFKRFRSSSKTSLTLFNVTNDNIIPALQSFFSRRIAPGSWSGYQERNKAAHELLHCPFPDSCPVCLPETVSETIREEAPAVLLRIGCNLSFRQWHYVFVILVNKT